jgi:hypothetical protein
LPTYRTSTVNRAPSGSDRAGWMVSLWSRWVNFAALPSTSNRLIRKPARSRQNLESAWVVTAVMTA